MAENRACDWLRQADSDTQFAESAVAAGFYAQACFIAQQAVAFAQQFVSRATLEFGDG